MGVRTSIVQTTQLLREAAVHIIRTGCGEAWLLQPKLRDFDTSEYRCTLPVIGDAAAEQCCIGSFPS